MKSEKIYRILYYILATVMVMAALLFITPIFFFDQFKINGQSMEPTLVTGDHVLVNKLLMGARIYTKYDFSDHDARSDGLSLAAIPFSKEYRWTIRNLGPLYIPEKGGEVKITPSSVRLYKKVIEYETGFLPVADKGIVYRSTFEINEELAEEAGRIPEEDCPSIYDDLRIKDMTAIYASGRVENLEIPDSAFYSRTPKSVVYLASSSYMSWMPLTHAFPEKGKVVFKDIAKGGVLRVVSIDGGRMRFLTDPFWLNTNGSPVFFRPDGSYQDMNIYAKHTLIYELPLRKRIIGGVFEAGNSPDFSSPDTLAVIEQRADRLVNVLKFKETGLDLGEKKVISKVEYIPRNRDNYIRKGDTYEMFYCDKIWKSCGTVTAESDSIAFRNVPSGTIYIVKNHTRGSQMRIFIYKDGKQIWK